MKRASVGFTPDEMSLILETVENSSHVLRTKERKALTVGEVRKPGVQPKMERLVHRLGDRFASLSEGAIRPMVKNWFELEKRGDEQRAILTRLDALNRKATGSALEELRR